MFTHMEKRLLFQPTTARYASPASVFALSGILPADMRLLLDQETHTAILLVSGRIGSYPYVPLLSIDPFSHQCLFDVAPSLSTVLLLSVSFSVPVSTDTNARRERVGVGKKSRCSSCSPRAQGAFACATELWITGNFAPQPGICPCFRERASRKKQGGCAVNQVIRKDCQVSPCFSPEVCARQARFKRLSLIDELVRGERVEFPL